MEASKLTELPCEGRKSCLQRRKGGLAAEKLIETDERLKQKQMRSPPLRTSTASSQMRDPQRISSQKWDHLRIFSRKRDFLLGVSRVPYLLAEEQECRLEKGSSSVEEL